MVHTFRYAIPDDYQKRLLIVMVESTEGVRNLDEILQVEGVDLFFVGPGDLSQSMGFSPSVKPGERRDQTVLDTVDDTLRRIRAAGKRAGTLAVRQDVGHLVSVGAQLIYYHADPFLVEGVRQMRAAAEQGLTSK